MVIPVSTKSISPKQKYPPIIESYVCIVKIFVFISEERPMNVLISFGIFTSPKESK